MCEFYSKMDGAVGPLKWAKPDSDKHTFVLQVESRNEEIQLIVKVENWERRMRWGGVERGAYEMGMGLSTIRCIICTQNIMKSIL